VVTEVEGDRGVGAREKRGREVSGRRRKRGWEAREMGKLCNIAQYFAIEKVQRGRRQQK